MSDAPQFTEIDLTKTTKHGSDELTVGPTYLCLIGECYYMGTFSKVWFGLSFSGGMNSLQYDPPGTNASRWKRAWRFDNAELIRQTESVVDALLKGIPDGTLRRTA